MQRFSIVLAGLALVAAGLLAAASIAAPNGGASLLDTTTGAATTAATTQETETDSDSATHVGVQMCHHTRSKKHPLVTITVDQHAVNAHLERNDVLGACSALSPATSTAATPETTPSHGHGKGHGKP